MNEKRVIGNSLTHSSEWVLTLIHGTSVTFATIDIGVPDLPACTRCQEWHNSWPRRSRLLEISTLNKKPSNQVLTKRTPANPMQP